MTHRDMVVIGASAGGVYAFQEVLSHFPEDFPAAVFMTIHTSPNDPNLLPDVLAGSCRLPIINENSEIKHGRVYVAKPNLHLIVKRGHVEHQFLAKENMARPAIDPMFRSAAHSYSRRVIGVLMTGNLDDGTAGLGLIKDEGGITVVQDPKDAKYPGMPLTALEYAPVDYSIPLREIGPLIVNLVHSEIEEVSRNMEAQNHESGQVLSCPGCGGILTQESAGKIELYLCQVGHRYTRESLILAQNEEVEHHLWSALAILKQKEEVARKISEDVRKSGSALDADSFEKQAQASAESQEMISRVLNLKGPVLFPPYFKWPPKGEESS